MPKLGGSLSPLQVIVMFKYLTAEEKKGVCTVQFAHGWGEEGTKRNLLSYSPSSSSLSPPLLTHGDVKSFITSMGEEEEKGEEE